MRQATRVGCCGWPMSRAEYFRRFPTVEIDSSFYNLPLLATASRWRDEAPEGFEFSLKAWQLITHPPSSPTYRRLGAAVTPRRPARCGHFTAGDEVESAWHRTAAVARALACRVILFQTPRSFYPSADHLRDMYRFFKGVPRGNRLLAWEPRGPEWDPDAVRRVCGDLGLVHACDPLAPDSSTAEGKPPPSVRGAPCYFRLHGGYARGRPSYDHSYSDDELDVLRERCEGRCAYVYFNNVSRGKDAARFLERIGSSSASGGPGTRRPERR